MNCKNCGAELKEDQKFCAKCGTPVGEKQQMEKVANNSDKETNVGVKKIKRRKKMKALIACVCCLAVIITGTLGGLYWHFSSNNKISESDKNYVYLENGFTDVKVTDEQSAIEAVASVADCLGIENVEKELKVSSVNAVDGNTYYRFQQYYNDIPVYGKSVVLSADKNGTAASLTSNVHSIDMAYDPSVYTDGQNQTVIYEKNKKAYICNVHYTPQDNDIIKTFKDIKSGDTIATLSTTYTNSEEDYIFENNGSFTVYDEVRNFKVLNSKKNILLTTFDVTEDNGDNKVVRNFYSGDNRDRIRDTEHDHFLGNLAEYHINNDISFVTSNSRGSLDSNAIQLAKNVQIAYDYYKDVFKRNGFDNCNSRMYVSYNDKISDSANGNNAYSNAGSLLSFGYKKDLSQIDLVAHEYTHSVELTISNMNYEGESGAIMEGYSDIFGEIIQAYDKNSEPDWVLDPKGTNRNIAYPFKSKEPQPGIYNGLYWKSTTDKKNKENKSTNDHGHVHNNSTVISHAAYLMWNGIDGNEDKKIDIGLLANLWYRALHLLQSDATFNQCANAVILTAESMLDSRELTQAQVACVRRSFEAVGIYADMLSDLSKSSTNGAAVKVKDINGNNLSSYYLKVTDKNSNVIIDSEFTESNPYIINISENGIYKFAVKETKSSSAKFVTNVRIFAVNKGNRDLNLQTSIDTGDGNISDSRNEKKDNINYGNIIVNNQCLYYWKYNSQSYVDDAIFGEYMYKQGTENQLICRNKDGNETIILETAGAGEIAIVNDRIFYQVPVNHNGKYSISTCKLDGTDIKTIGDGTLAAVSEDGYVIYSSGEQINSISTNDLSIKILADDAELKAVDGNQVYFQPRETDKEAALHGRTTLSAVNADGGNKRDLYITKDDLYRSGAYDSWTRSYARILSTHVSDGYIFYVYGSFAGSGRVFQGGKIVKVKLDGSGGEIMGEAYTEHPAFLVDKDNNIVCDYSYVKSAMNEPYFNNGNVSMYNQEMSAYEEYIVKNDYSSFSTDNISVYSSGNSGTLLQLGFMERIGDKVYFMLHKGIYDKDSSLNENEGMREYYTRIKSALFEKNLKSGKVALLYDFGKSDALDSNTIKGQFSAEILPQNAVEHNGHYYFLYKNSGFNSWEDAKTFCESQGGYLATISSEDENNFLFSYIISQNCQSAFFGLNDRETEGEWKWINDENVTYANWSEHEPNAETSLEDEAMFYWKYSDGKWNDGVFRKGDSFICEWGEYS